MIEEVCQSVNSSFSKYDCAIVMILRALQNIEEVAVTQYSRHTDSWTDRRTNIRKSFARHLKIFIFNSRDSILSCYTSQHHRLHLQLNTACTALHCTALYCTALYCTVLYCTVLYCTALHCTALHCTTLHCTTLYCTVLYCTALRSMRITCSTLSCCTALEINLSLSSRTP